MTLNNYIETIENKEISEEKYNKFKNNLIKNSFLLQDDYFKLFICNKLGLVQKLSIEHSNNTVVISR